MIPLFDRNGAESITKYSDAVKLVQMMPIEHRQDPNTTYQDSQCGTAFDALVLAEQLMIDLKDAIPDEIDRLNHIFKKQIYLSDISEVQVRIAAANIKRAVNDSSFCPNIEVKDCFENNTTTNYTFGSIDSATANKFVSKHLSLSSNVIVISKSSKNSFLKNKIAQLVAYQFVRRIHNTPFCILHVSNQVTNKTTFINNNKKVVVNNPLGVPNEDFDGWLFSQRILEKGFEGYIATQGPERPAIVNSAGSVPMVFKPSKAALGQGIKLSKDRNNGSLVGVSKSAATPETGYGVEKMFVAKSGNAGHIPNFYWDDGSLSCSSQTPWIAMSKEEFDKLTLAIRNEPCYNTLFKAVFVKTHTKNFWRKIPKIEHLDQVKEIYNEYYR